MAKSKNKKQKPSLGLGNLSNLMVTMPEQTKYHMIEDGKFQDFMKIKRPKCFTICASCGTYILAAWESKVDLLSNIINSGKIFLTLSQGIWLICFIAAIFGFIIFGALSWMGESKYNKILKDIVSRPAIMLDPKLLDKIYASQKTKT